MADLTTRDVVNDTQSAGGLPPTDAPLTTTTTELNDQSGEKDTGEKSEQHFNDHQSPAHLVARDDQSLEDAASKSDTDSRADGSIAGSKTSEHQAVKRPLAAKPVSFVKYSVPKVIEAAKKAAADKGSLALNPACGE